MLNQTANLRRAGVFEGAATWLWLSVGAAALAIVGNGVGLLVTHIYAGLTPAFLPQALAQDVANLAVTAPAWLLLVALALRGSLQAYLVWLGVLTFTVYNYVIYTFSIPFGPLFLLWVAVLGMSLFALVGGVAAVNHDSVKAAFPAHGPRAVKVAAWVLIGTAVFFGFVWLSEDIPALLSGRRPQSLVDMALPTNPVHILDLAFFLPAVIAAGILLRKGRPLAYTLAPMFMAFLVLTGVPILMTPVVQAARGEPAAWGVAIPIGTLTAALSALLAWLLASMQPDPRSGRG